MHPLEQQQIVMLRKFADLHIQLDELDMDKERRKRLRDRAWNLLQDIKETTVALRNVPPPTPEGDRNAPHPAKSQDPNEAGGSGA